MNAIVTYILDDGLRLIINKGFKDGVRKGDYFSVYSNMDMFSKNNHYLGRIKNTCGTGIVISLGKELSIIESTKIKYLHIYTDYNRNFHITPFYEPQVGFEAVLNSDYSEL